ncbi:MAG: glycosyltransferase family 2 protein [Deltaproteobacteria bacterium]|nr:glycosyltransferase family 2 protein [Deltaproteobacteria bacterium]
MTRSAPPSKTKSRSSVSSSTSASAKSSPERVVVMIPCYNEELTVEKVVTDFRRALPKADIVVFDNNSTDQTAELARRAGARVIFEKRPGKGFVVDAMFRRLEADYYVMVDGDATYSAKDVEKLLAPLRAERADMVVGTRLKQYKEKSFRPLHVLGNRSLTGLVNWIFQTRLGDMMSGYRAMTRDLVKSVPILSGGFEVETELTIRTLERRFVIHEVALPYHERPEGSFSKLRTFHDGFRVAFSILRITRTYKPFFFFGAIGLGFAGLGLGAGWLVVQEYLETQFITHVPLAILATGCMILSFGSVGIGIILNSINQRIAEITHLLREDGHVRP